MGKDMGWKKKYGWWAWEAHGVDKEMSGKKMGICMDSGYVNGYGIYGAGGVDHWENNAWGVCGVEREREGDSDRYVWKRIWGGWWKMGIGMK